MQTFIDLVPFINELPLLVKYRNIFFDEIIDKRLNLSELMKLRKVSREIKTYIDSKPIIKTLLLLIKSGAIANRLLYKACKTGFIEIVELIINKRWVHGGIEWNVEWNAGLGGACKGGHVDIINFMISKGADSGCSFAIYKACEGGHIDIIKMMIKITIKQNGISNSCWWLNQSLYLACKKGHIEVVNLIIEKGANNLDFGLIGACTGGHVDVAKMMLEKGATNLNTALQKACEEGRIEVVDFLLTKGAYCLNSGLRIACRGKYTSIAKLLISKGANNCTYCGNSQHAREMHRQLKLEKQRQRQLYK
jgi:hypothetical protein